MSQQHRHGYAADLPHGLPTPEMKTPPEVPAAPVHGKDALRPAHIRQVRAGVKVEGRNNAGSSRTPFHHARRTRTIWQYWPRPGFVRAAPTLPGTTRIRLPPAPPTCCDRPETKVSHLHSKHSTSRRKQKT